MSFDGSPDGSPASTNANVNSGCRHLATCSSTASRLCGHQGSEATLPTTRPYQPTSLHVTLT
eukprot:4338736-Pleurochrysis_carterae.AAC.1